MRQHWGKAAVIAAFIGLCGPAPAAWAWSENGHRTISFIAERYLRPPALDEVNRLLATDIATSDGLDLISAAGWADRYRDTTAARDEATFRWHFADIQVARPDIPKACFDQRPLPRGIPASEGPPEDCVITKIGQFAAELADRRLPPPERLLALKFLIHLIGDLHQPLHVTDEHDDHGRLIGVSAPNLPDGTLFSYWDDVLIARLGSTREPWRRSFSRTCGKARRGFTRAVPRTSGPWRPTNWA